MATRDGLTIIASFFFSVANVMSITVSRQRVAVVVQMNSVYSS